MFFETQCRMVFHGELSIGTSPSEKRIYGKCCLWSWPLNPWPWKCHQVRWTRSRVTVIKCNKIILCTLEISEKNASHSAYLTVCGLAVTLKFDLSTLESNPFIFVINCIEAVNMVKFPREVSRYRVNKLSVNDQGRTHALSRTAPKRNASHC